MNKKTLDLNLKNQIKNYFVKSNFKLLQNKKVNRQFKIWVLFFFSI